MGEQFKITVCELNLQGNTWKKKEKEKISEQIKGIFDKLKKEMEQRRQGISKSLDVIVLTEVCDKQCEIIQDKLKEYEWGVSEIANTFRVVIGVNKSFGDLKLIEVTSDKSTHDIDLLKVRFKLDGRFFTVIGCRFTTGIVNKEQDKDKQMRKQYDSECVAFCSTLLPFVNKCIDDNENENDIFILAGDFNNAQCYGDLKEKYNSENYIKKKTREERAQIHYNLHLIKDWLKPYGFEMADIRKDEKGRKQPIPTHQKRSQGFPIDHIFVRGLTVEEDNVCGTITVGDLSDHAIIWADFDMKE